MDIRRLLLALGSGATTFLLVGALLASQIPDIPGGIIGFFGGLFAGLLAVVGVWVVLGSASSTLTRLVTAYAVFGYAFLAIWFLRYAHVAGLRSSVDVSLQVVLSVAIAVLVALGDWVGRRRETGQ
ncbi:hypothetical protein [Haloarchaeobius amylolyticus]|uniref:hypothetical protein n=1 Tax=Haloarchaeobius amylolyticus TaxID=1198296 RepID=UPI00227114CE|nr:hypothetical protein [Haloarchaeobius amylolyticus]